jgi:uncharacterized membrane protein YqjE
MPESGGLMGSAKRLLDTLLGVVATRLELLANELQEERLRLTQMLFFALGALFFLGMTVLVLTVFVVVLFWDEHRLAVLFMLSVFFFLAGLLMAMLYRQQARAKPRLFAASLAELHADRQQLESDRG